MLSRLQHWDGQRLSTARKGHPHTTFRTYRAAKAAVIKDQNWAHLELGVEMSAFDYSIEPAK